MAYVVAAFIFLVGMVTAAIVSLSGFYGNIGIKIAIGATAAAVLIALTHDRIPSW